MEFGIFLLREFSHLSIKSEYYFLAANVKILQTGRPRISEHESRSTFMLFEISSENVRLTCFFFSRETFLQQKSPFAFHSISAFSLWIKWGYLVDHINPAGHDFILDACGYITLIVSLSSLLFLTFISLAFLCEDSISLWHLDRSANVWHCCFSQEQTCLDLLTRSCCRHQLINSLVFVHTSTFCVDIN